MSTSCTPDMRRDDSILFPRNNQPGPSGIGPSVDPPYLSRTTRTGLEVHRRSSRPARIQAMHRASTIRTAALLAVLRCGFAGEALAQTVHNPLVPRGSFFVRLHPSATTLRATYGPGTGEEHPLGTAFGPADLGTAAVPSLAPLGERVAALTGMNSSPSLRLGRTVTRFSGDERAVPIQLSYGVLDRLTLAVTVPLVRKRLETVLRFSPEDADLGTSPSETAGASVSSFLRDAGASLETTRARVRDHCLTAGADDPACASGEVLVAEADFFLSELDAAYSTAPVFPLRDSQAASAITSRWNDLTNSFGSWGVSGPTDLPLASDPIDQETFESLVVTPAWPSDGFPLATPDVALGLGDVEATAAVGILTPAPPAPDADPPAHPRIHLAATGTLRFATGTPDSLRIVAPMDPPRGVSGWTGGAVLDILLSGPLRRLAVLSTLEAGWNGSREMTVLAPDPARVFYPGEERAAVLWTPGPHFRASVTPRIQVASGLSIGAGWRFLRREPDSYERLGEAPAAPIEGAAPEPYSLHRIGFEFRYAANEPPLLGGVPFPVEVLFRGSKSVAGTAGATVESRAEAMVRFRIRE